MAEQMQFEVNKVGKFGASGTGKRETVDDREVKARSILSASPVTFVGQLGEVYGEGLAAGRELVIGGVTLTTAEPKDKSIPHSLACRICGKVHGKPTKAMVRRGEGWKGNRLALLYILTQNGKPILVSESCAENYFAPAATAKNVTNFADVVRVFGVKK